MLDRLAVWWLKRTERLVPFTGVARQGTSAYGWALVPRGAKPWPRWVRFALQTLLVAVVALGALGYCYRYSLLGSAPGP